MSRDDRQEPAANIDRLRDFFRDRIGPGRRFHTAREMAAELNLEPTRATILYKFLKGAEPRAGIVLDWLEKLGISVIYPKEGASCEGVEYIPVFNGRTGAGAYYPSEGDGECETIRAVDRAFINRLRVSPNNLYFLDVMGDSMEPLFSDGATLLVDTSDNAKHYLMDGKIYVVNLEDAVLVKRIQMSPDEIVLCSENPMHAPIRVPASEMDRFRVIGRVRWYTVNA